MTIVLKPNRFTLKKPPEYHRRTPKDATKGVQRLGDAKRAEFNRNCLFCSRWSACKDEKKNANYLCSRFREATIDESIDSLFGDFDPMGIASEKVKEEDFAPARKIEGEESIVDMIAKVINSNVPVPPDLRIDDREIPLAKNFYHWITNEKFGKAGQPPFPRQVEFGVKLFGEWCPRCSDSEWFDDMRVDAPVISIREHVQFLHNGVCPKCKATKSELFLCDELPNYFGMVALIGQRASKTSSAILWDTYNLHKTLKLPSPQSVFGVMATQVITSTYTALTFAQAVENVWNPYLNALKDTPWFNNYHKFLDRKANELGEELYNLGEHMVRYRHRNLLLAPSGPSKRTMRGRTRLASITDEIGQFPTAKKSGKSGEEFEKLDAGGVFAALNNSLKTLKVAYTRRIEEGFNDLPKPMMYMPSSPSAYNDFIMNAYRTYQNSREFFSVKMATWEYRPDYKKSDFAEEFRTKPVEAARDYECNPPIGEGLFIEEHAPLIKAFKNGINRIQVSTKSALSRTKVKMTEGSVKIVSNNLPSRGTMLCVDLGLVNNSCSFSIIGPADDHDSDVLPEDRGTMQTPVTVYAVGEIIPKIDTRISLTAFYSQCIIPLIEPFNITYFVSDRWNSAKMAQDLENGYNVVPIEHKATWADFEATRDLLYSGNLLMPRLTESFDDIIKTTLDQYPECFRSRPVDHLAWQFATVRESTGVTVLKGDGGTDDTFRTIVLGVAMMQDDEILEELLSVNNGKTPPRPFMGLVRRLSGAGGQVAGGASGSGGFLGITKRLSR
ncbi:terminase large subunit protein [Rhizobium phage RHph_N28_1]|nr:terminase large subunit protein [Rhizobium phage RHph_N28_1]QIG74290.1 terminase large subunit protein [Rhizobium phage RHph_N42]QXV73949.1 terminase large subunit protein [Rhizobium phage RHph_N46]